MDFKNMVIKSNKCKCINLIITADVSKSELHLCCFSFKIFETRFCMIVYDVGNFCYFKKST